MTTLFPFQQIGLKLQLFFPALNANSEKKNLKSSRKLYGHHRQVMTAMLLKILETILHLFLIF